MKVALGLGLVVGLVISGCSNLASAQTNCNVVKIADGDTITVSCDGAKERVRLCGIDAPETKKPRQREQPYANESKALIKRLLSNGKVQLVQADRDRYGRIVGELYVGNTFINAELVKAGLAYEYKQYSKSCPNRVEIRNAEAIAQRNKVGVWDGGNYQAPWDFRKSNGRN